MGTDCLIISVWIDSMGTENEPLKDSKTMLRMKWLYSAYRDVPNIAKTHQLWTPYLKAFFLHLIGCFLIPEPGSGVVHAHYLTIMDDMNEMGRFAWGAAALARMHVALAAKNVYGLRLALQVCFLNL